MPIRKLKEFLDNHQVKFTTLIHSQAYTAQEVAMSIHIPGKELAKTVMVKMDGKMAMAVLPATRRVDWTRLKSLASCANVELACEDEFRSAFPECETGAMPPFGNLYGMPVFVDSGLTEDDEISFNAGSHTELVRLSYKDFERLVRPKIGEFAAAG